MEKKADSTLLPSMRGLLERAGFSTRSATRADCAHCTGRSRGIVSFTQEAGHCFRCGWKANALTLAGELGLLGNDPLTREQLRIEAQQRARVEEPLREFERWRESRIHRVSDHFYRLSRRAILAHSRATTWARTPMRRGRDTSRSAEVYCVATPTKIYLPIEPPEPSLGPRGGGA